MKTFLSASLLAAALLAPAPAVAAIPADSLFQLIHARSVHRASADWARLDSSYRSGMAAAKNERDTVRTVVRLFEALGDVHSQLIVDGRAYAHSPDYDVPTLARLRPLVQRSQREAGIARTAVLDGRWLYVRVPGMSAWSGNRVNEASQALADSLCARAGGAAGEKIKGVVLDLRANGGGNLAVMAAGLGSLLGDGPLGASLDAEGERTRVFAMAGGEFSMNGVAMARANSRCPASFATLPVAVIIGPATISSGSITAMLFRGRPRTALIGEPTAAGYTTGNDWIALNERVQLNLATEYNADRTGTVHRESVAPDIRVKGDDDFTDLPHDPKVWRAIRWLTAEAKRK